MLYKFYRHPRRKRVDGPEDWPSNLPCTYSYSTTPYETETEEDLPLSFQAKDEPLEEVTVEERDTEMFEDGSDVMDGDASVDNTEPVPFKP